MNSLRSTHVHLLLNKEDKNAAEGFSVLLNYVTTGHFNKIFGSSIFQRTIFQNTKFVDVIQSSNFEDVNLSLDVIIKTIERELTLQLEGNQNAVSNHMFLFAITLLQCFVQLNYTGPSIDLNIGSMTSLEKFNKKILASLSSMGQTAYDLAESPYLLAFSIRILEILNDSPVSFLNLTAQLDNTEELINNSNINSTFDKENDIFLAAVQWWRSRAYQIQTSLLPEPSSVLTSVSALLLNTSVLEVLAKDLSDILTKQLCLVFQLEIARNGINTNTEHLSVVALAKAKKISGLSLILTGCKAKRTRFQETAHSGLVILANNETILPDDEDENTVKDGPASFQLNDDTLLEKPQYDSVGVEMNELLNESDSKRIKLDYSNSTIGENEDQDEKLLPIAFSELAIPEELQKLDPNNQPKLGNFDMVQLLLRFVCIKQTSPSNSAMVDEELMALIQRILYSPEGSVNWSIYSRSLWERSLLESNKAKTVERGVLQMQSLVEELGMSSVKSKLFSRTTNDETPLDQTEDGPLPSAKRLKLIHQLPLMPRWAMDANLAEKYMSLGALKSAIEIYERLHMWNEAAICNGAVGNEKEALEFLERRLNENPNDGRALSIMGDIKQDPVYWNKSWEVSRYPKAKNALARYYYSPPKSSGLTKDLEKAIENQYDSLKVNPLSYDSWYFYGCLGLEAGNYELAAEAFTRCVSIDDENAHAWSNLSSALVSLDKLKPAFSALQRAVRVGQDLNSWRIWENYLIVAAKLKQWDDVLAASRQLLNITKESNGQNAIDIPIVERLVDILLSTEYNESFLTHFQKSCIEYVCVSIPRVINSSARTWRIIAKVEQWRKRPWAALDCLEKLYRALLNNPELDVDKAVWDEAVDICSDLVAAYESFGELPGKHGAGDVVCKDWKYKAKSSVRSMMSKGRNSWEDTEGYAKLQEMKEELMN